jgi:hypothetical protein
MSLRHVFANRASRNARQASQRSQLRRLQRAYESLMVRHEALQGQFQEMLSAADSKIDELQRRNDRSWLLQIWRFW